MQALLKAGKLRKVFLLLGPQKGSALFTPASVTVCKGDKGPPLSLATLAWTLRSRSQPDQ